MTSDKSILNSIRAVLLDVDGTLWRGGQALPGLGELFALLHARGIGYRIVTNSSLQPPRHYRDKLAGFGVTVDDSAILTSATATGRYLARMLPVGAPVYVIGETGLLAAVQQAGMVVVGDAAQTVAAVVVGGDRSLTYTKLKDAVFLLQRGAPLIGTNPDLLVPTAAGLAPETGTTLAALTAATGVAPTVIGKPAPWLFAVALEQLGILPGHALMVGDRLETDILGGQRAGLRTALVTTGVDSAAAVVEKGIRPDLVVRDLAELVQRWDTEAR